MLPEKPERQTPPENDAPACKHCGLSLRADGNGSHVHAEGYQRGLHRCAADPYGFNAEPVGAECGRTCNGSRGVEVTRVYPPGMTGSER